MLAFLNTPTFPVFSPPTYFNPAFILRFYLSFIFYLAFIYCVLLFTNIIYHVMRTDTCNKPHTLRDAVTGRNRNLHSQRIHPKFVGIRKKFGSIRNHLKGLTFSVILLGNRIISGEYAANINVLHSQDIRHSVRVA